MNIDLGYIAIVFGVILLSMTLHEAMHAYVGHWLGDDTAKLSGRLTLNPLAHIDPFLTIILPLLLAIAGLPIFGGAKPVPFNPNRVRYGEYGVALVGVAGPLTNLALAFILFAVFAFSGAPSSGTLVGLVLQTAILVNLGFFIFNILPIPPLDGSRVLYAIAPDAVRRFLETVERFGLIVVFAVILLFSQQLSQFLQGAIRFFLTLFGNLFGVQVL